MGEKSLAAVPDDDALTWKRAMALAAGSPPVAAQSSTMPATVYDWPWKSMMIDWPGTSPGADCQPVVRSPSMVWSGSHVSCEDCLTEVTPAMPPPFESSAALLPVGG